MSNQVYNGQTRVRPHRVFGGAVGEGRPSKRCGGGGGGRRGGGVLRQDSATLG